MDEAASDALRPHLLASVDGLEHLWQEAYAHVSAAEPGTDRWQRWQDALRVVAHALDETELLTGETVPPRPRRGGGAGGVVDRDDEPHRRTG